MTLEEIVQDMAERLAALESKVEGLSIPDVRVGDTLYGYCNGFFGRDSYGPKEVTFVGRDYIVAEEDGQVVTATFNDGWDISIAKEWLDPDEEY